MNQIHMKQEKKQVRQVQDHMKQVLNHMNEKEIHVYQNNMHQQDILLRLLLFTAAKTEFSRFHLLIEFFVPPGK